MFNVFRTLQFSKYRSIRKALINNPEILEELESYFTNYLVKKIEDNLSDIKADYDEASYLYPFWQQYPPDKRGRKPRGDQYPWIEVGEHVIGDKLPRLIQQDFAIRDVGLPTGPDKRFLLKSSHISQITGNLTSSVWLFIDIKSVGPRDDFDHTVMSHNQVSGDGLWDNVSGGIKNSVMFSVGKHKRHKFYSTIPPIYVLSDGTVAPVILIALKPVYKMLNLEKKSKDGGQPLKKITVISIPNGLLLEKNPGYLKKYPKLLFPGKDDKTKNPLKVRSRISFSILRKLDKWRVQDILVK